MIKCDKSQKCGLAGKYACCSVEMGRYNFRTCAFYEVVERSESAQRLADSVLEHNLTQEKLNQARLKGGI